RMNAAELLSSGMIGDPDPYTAAMNALELFRVDDVVISTLPDERSGWLRANLIERVQHATSARVEHVVSDPQATTAAAKKGQMEAASTPPPAAAHGDHGHDHHGPPPANVSSRVNPQLLGMLLFIISEIMVFGAFFTAYFFIRIAQGEPWPAHGTDLPV